MSVRVAEAIHAALTYRAEHHSDDFARTARVMATRTGHAIDRAKSKGQA